MGVRLSSEETDSMVGSVEAANDTASIGDLGFFSVGTGSSEVSLSAAAAASSSSAFFLRSTNIKGFVRAEGIFFTGSTMACLPLAPFHGGRRTGSSRGSCSTGEVSFAKFDGFVASRSFSPARICRVLSFN
jgi:hypothetical protein